MITTDNLHLITELENLSGVRIHLVENGITNKLDEWNRDFPSVLTSFMYNSFQKLAVLDFLNADSICHVSHPFGLENVYIPVQKDTFFVIGPYSSVYHSTDEVNSRLSEYQITPNRGIYHFFSNDLPIISAHKINSVKKLICQLFNITTSKQEFLQYDAGKKVSVSTFISEKAINEQERMLHRREGLLSIIQAVSEGDHEKCVQILLETAPYKISKHFSTEALENERISAIQNASLFYFSAIKGGTNPNDADKLYIQTIHKILRSSTATDVYKVSTDMLRAFCELVRQSQSPAYSGLVQQVINYLSFHTNAELNMDDICFTFKLSQNKLEKLFKAECQTTILKYHRRMRIETAAKLLKNHNLTINQIALQTGFLDQNYFSRVFKSYYNCTPSQYRLNADITY